MTSVSEENFQLGILGGAELPTPSIYPINPIELSEDVLWVTASIIFALNLFSAEFSDVFPIAYPHWAQISGINADNFNNSDLILSVYPLYKDRETRLCTERLLYGVSANENSQAIEPLNLVLKGMVRIVIIRLTDFHDVGEYLSLIICLIQKVRVMK